MWLFGTDEFKPYFAIKGTGIKGKVKWMKGSQQKNRVLKIIKIKSYLHEQ